MTRVVLFDLGLTLIDAAERPFPHAVDALKTIQDLRTPDGAHLLTALVSDVDMPDPPATPAKIKAIADRYAAVLDRTGLRPFFEPLQRRVTLSAHAGVFKPDRRIFETALRRLRTTASLAECVFLTENGEHVRAVREQLGMHALRFRAPAASDYDFEDWLQAPPLVAHLVDGGRGAASEAALIHFLDVAHGFDLQTVDRANGTLIVHGRLWRPVDDGSPDPHPLLAPFPAEGRVTRGADGRIHAVQFTEPAPAVRTEAASFARSLARHGQMAGAPSPLGDASTHTIEIDAYGRRKLVRTRFRAV
jgi:FMN phosphatase YigB (HAD superfamily)